MRQVARYLGLAILCLLSLTTASGQMYNMTKYSTATKGLPSNYVYDMVQDENGFLWMATGEGLSRFDGVSLITYTVADSLADDYVTSLTMDKSGNLWSGHGNGQLTFYDGTKFQKINITDVSAPLKSLCLDDRGNIWCIEQNKGIIKVSPSFELTKYHDRKIFGRQTYNALQAINTYNILIGTNDGLMLVRLDVDGKVSDIETFPDLEYQSVQCIVPSRDNSHYWVGTDDGRIFNFSLTKGVTEIAQCTSQCSPSGETPSVSIRDIYEDENGKLYLATWGSGVMQLERSLLNERYITTMTLTKENGLGNDYISDITVDREGIFWFSTYGEGAISWVNNYFSEYRLSEIGFQQWKITDVCVDDEYMWIGLNRGLLKMDRQCVMNHEYLDSSYGLPNTAVSDILIDKDQTIYVGTEDSGIYYRKAGNKNFQKLHYTSPTKTTDMVNHMVMHGKILYIATQGGFIAYSTTNNQSEVFTTNNGLPHNCINHILIDDSARVWIGPKDSGITMLETSSDVKNELPEDATWEVHRLSEDPINVPSMTMDANNIKWLLSMNNGILCASADSIIPITTINGLEKNFCYDITTDRHNRVWVCHQPGLSCIDLKSNSIRRFNTAMGFDQEYVHAFTDKDGDVWFASHSSILHYSAKLDNMRNIAPIINQTRSVVSGEEYLPSEGIDLGYPYFRDIDKFDFSFVGICMRDPSNVMYRYWLQIGDDSEPKWSSPTMNAEKSYDYLPDGDYVLHAKAINSNGVESENIITIPIHIDKPFWKSIFFPILLVFGIYYLIRIIIKNREKVIKKREEELEREVQRQTAQLQRQKFEIERKNKDITDSINYANRIQTAILPSRLCLKEYDLADSFLLFRPKAIVSGDCYWVGKYDDHLLICCGDCTGHGVPGAFMSMIVTTVINDAVRNEELRHPAKLLEVIDQDIKHTLNKNQVVEAQDGMDCAILDINLATRELVSAGARRPVLIFKKDKFIEIRPTRRSVGERRNGNEFTEETTQLAPGDVIYAFSDGFTDQFNMMEEKYTSGKLKRLLQEIYTLPMEEQQEKLEQEFETWMGNHEQMDDVIIMGIKLK